MTRTWQIDWHIQSDLTILNQNHAIRQRDSLVHIMSDEQRRKAVFQPQIFEQLLHFDSGQGV